MKTKFKQYDKVLCTNISILEPYYNSPIRDCALEIVSLDVPYPQINATFAILTTGKHINNDPKNHEIRYAVPMKYLTTKNFLPTEVRCESGLMGWQDFVRNVYESYDELERFSEVYGVSTRLGYSVKKLWDENPIIQGSTNPSDLKIVWRR
jgi:hypothetical protein